MDYPFLFCRLFARVQVWISFGQDFFNWNDATPTLYNLDQTPALGFADRATLFNAYSVANLTAIVLIMGMEAFRLLKRTLVNAMFFQGFNDYNNRLIRFIAHHTPDFLNATA